MSAASRVLRPCSALLLATLARKRAAEAQERPPAFDRIHFSKPDYQRAPSPGADVQTLPLFPLGMTSFIPHSGAETIHVFEPRYRKLYLDMLGWTAMVRWPLLRGMAFSVSWPGKQASQAKQPCLVGVWMGVDDQGTYMSAAGVLLDVVSWTREDVFPPLYEAVHETGPRVRILRLVNPEATTDLQSYFLAEVEVLHEAPTPDDHSEILEAWREVWAALRTLLELQEEVGETPRLKKKKVMAWGRDRTLVSSSKCWLTATDVWRPVGLVQELYQLQAESANVKHQSVIRSARDAGLEVADLEHAYKLELERLVGVLRGIQRLLQEDTLEDVLWELLDMVEVELRRLQARGGGGR